MNDLINRGATDLSADAVNELLGGIVDSRSTTPIAGGRPIMRLLKSGTWVFGQEDEPVQLGSEWAINPRSIMHGWSCWTSSPDPKTKNELLGELMTPISNKKPLKPEPIRGFEWAEQRVWDMMCMNGADEGVEVIYKTSSIGGMRAVDNYLAGLIVQLRANAKYPVGIVQLESKPYDHAKFGQIFNPIFNLVGWATMDGDVAPAAAAQVTGNGGAAIGAKAAPAPKAAAAPAKPAKPAKAPLTPAAAAPAAAPQEATSAPEEEEVEQTVAASTARPGAAPRRQRPSGRA